MDYFSIVVIAIALAMDAFSVSISAGICIEKPDPRHYFRLSFHFGLFQFITCSVEIIFIQCSSRQKKVEFQGTN